MKRAASACDDLCVSLQKEKSYDNIPKEPVVFEKMKLVSRQVMTCACELSLIRGPSAFRVELRVIVLL